MHAHFLELSSDLTCISILRILGISKNTERNTVYFDVVLSRQKVISLLLEWHQLQLSDRLGWIFSAFLGLRRLSVICHAISQSVQVDICARGTSGGERTVPSSIASVWPFDVCGTRGERTVPSSIASVWPFDVCGTRGERTVPSSIASV